MRPRLNRIAFALSLLALTAVAVAAPGAKRATEGHAKALAQAAADAAALAGAASFLEAHDDGALARRRAIEYVDLNSAPDVHLSLGPEGISINLAEGTIEVRVEARQRSLPPFLARLVGIESVVTAKAAAEAQDLRCVNVGVSAEGYPMERCEGQVKYLRLVSPPS